MTNHRSGVLARASLACRLALAAALLATAACREPTPRAEPLLRSVRYVVVESRHAGSRQTFSGMVRAGTESRLSFQVSGRIERVAVKVGQSVASGAFIAALDPADFVLQLAQSRASLAQARSAEVSADSTYERVRKLYANANASRQELDNARAQRDGARSAASAAQQAVRRLERQLGYATLRAPARGTISRVEVEQSEVVVAGQVVAVLQVGEQLDVAVDVPESLVNRLSTGDAARVSVGTDDEQLLEASVFEIGVPSKGAAIFPVSVRLKKAPKEVRAGMAAEVTFSTRPQDEQPDALLVPVTAVGEDRAGRFVFLIEGESRGKGRVKRVPVEVGEITTEGIRVTSGLRPGVKLVTAGVSRIQDGLEVRVPPLPGGLGAAPKADAPRSDAGAASRTPE